MRERQMCKARLGSPEILAYVLTPLTDLYIKAVDNTSAILNLYYLSDSGEAWLRYKGI